MVVMYLCSTVHLSYTAKFSDANRGRETTIPPVQLTTSRIGYHSRVIHTLLKVLTINTYIHIVGPMVLPFIGESN